MALSMAHWMALCGRHIGAVVSGSIGLVVAASESRIDLAIQFLLDEPAAAGRRLKFSRKAQVLGTPYPEPANALDADTGGITDVLDIGEAFQSLEQLALCQASQFRDGLVQPISGCACLAAVCPSA
jgi:hypothetical protein